MSILVPSSIAPAPSASPGGKAPARAAEQDQNQNQPGSFGEALARSRQPAAEKPVAKPAAPAPARRQAGPEKTESQGLDSPMAALLLPFESRMAAAKLPVGSAASGDRAVVRGGTASSDPLAETPLVKGSIAEAPEVAAGTTTQGMQATRDTLAAMLAAASSKSAGQAPVQAGDVKVQAGPITAANPRAMAAAAAAPAGAAGADLAAPSSKQGDKGTAVAGASGDARANLALAAADATAGTGSAWLLRPAGATSQPPGVVSVSSPAIAANPRAMAAAAAAPAGAAGADLADPSSRQGDEDKAVAGASGDARADLALAAADAAAGTGSAWLLQPAGAALQPPGGGSVPNAPAPVATAWLAPPVGSSEWSKALGQQVIHLGTAEHQVAELQLNPPGLGPLKVTLSMNDQQMQAMFVSAHSSVRAAVEAALPQLRAQLAESGISLGNTSVGAESQPQTAFSNGQNGQGGQPPRGAYRTVETDTAALFSAQPATAQVRSSQGLRIDTFA
jgi:flagellar hook-length control protein FliK